MTKISNYLALDVGDVRIGVARASGIARIAEPLMTLPHDQSVWQKILDLCEQYEVDHIVVGLPRNMYGAETKQSESIRKFAAELKKTCQARVVMQDESLTTVAASERTKEVEKHGIDAVAASEILDSYLREHQHAL